MIKLSESDKVARAYGAYNELCELTDSEWGIVGTCKNDSLKKHGVFFCSNCKLHVDIAYMDSVFDYSPKFCPECGHKVID